jgi:TetR/AcrR family transcriptional repressor of nem operon
LRKSKLETAETRRRIVAAASREFHRRGFDGASLVDLMASAGLTPGGFYKHFGSKEQLMGEALAAAAETELKAMERTLSTPPGARGLEAVVKAYLSVEHCEDVADGCPFVALGSELALSNADLRGAATAGLRQMVALMADSLGNLSPEAAESEAIATLSTMIGSLTLARMVADPVFASRILQAGRAKLTSRRPRAPDPPVAANVNSTCSPIVTRVSGTSPTDEVH